MELVRVTKDNIDKEDICCAMSNNKSLAKKAWMKERFNDGLTFVKSRERGKCFIEYIPAEKAWNPIEADGYMFINCMWVSGSLKGHGYSNELLKTCLDDAKTQNKKGVCVLSSAKKKEFLSDGKYLAYKGFKVADETDCGINMMYYPFDDAAEAPRFKECAKKLTIDQDGIVIYYTDQCPFTDYWVPRVCSFMKEQGIEITSIKVDTLEKAQNMPAPVSMYALFKDSKFVTQSIQSDKKLLALANK